ncbi:hypothetical protein [Novacetimonas pomaceti]|uniref:hypothetical protein n=1 Tax=Novacetimonas pomaceti TaxID=2021998 RepID=UPI001C2DBCD6|nr:hypothetical protein [Novacetimonas pomaceti]MBV1835179.1 hypothetical protein [Novacetimonas pomaceti]
MRRFPFLLAAMLLVGGVTGAFPALGKENATRQRQASACQGDALRLCTTSIPDEGRIAACLQRKFDRLSPRCRAMFHPATPDSTTPPPPAQEPPSGDHV